MNPFHIQHSNYLSEIKRVSRIWLRLQERILFLVLLLNWAIEGAGELFKAIGNQNEEGRFVIRKKRKPLLMKQQKNKPLHKPSKKPPAYRAKQNYKMLSPRPDPAEAEQLAEELRNAEPIGNKGISVYRGYALSDDASKRNLSKQQTIMDVIGKPKQEVDLLPFEYYTESSDVATVYANRDNAIIEQIMGRTGKSQEQATEMFKNIVWQRTCAKRYC